MTDRSQLNIRGSAYHLHWHVRVAIPSMGIVLGFAIVLMDDDPDDAAAEVWKDKTKRLDASFLLVLVRSRLAAQLQVRGKRSMASRTAIASWWKRPGRVNSELSC